MLLARNQIPDDLMEFFEPAGCGECYVCHLVEVFREVRRVLRKDGTVWCNLGDSYAGSWGNQGRKAERGEQRPINGPMLTPVLDDRYPDAGSNTGKTPPGLKPKDLCGIPWRVAFALQADGWWLRSDIIWAKRNCMPESVTDRPTRSHEYLFLLTKSARYFYDADAIREADSGRPSGNGFVREHRLTYQNEDGTGRGDPEQWEPGGGRNKRSVWEIATQPFSWRQNARRVRVEPGDADDGTERITSPSCPVHGGRVPLRPTGQDGGHEDLPQSHSLDSDAGHAQGSLSDFDSTDQPLAPNSADGSLDSQARERSSAATAHSKRSHKTAPVAATSQPCTPSAETPSHTRGKSASPASDEPRPDTLESRTSLDDAGARPESGTDDGTVRRSSQQEGSACSCRYYRLEETDHFATFPPKLVEPCILAGSPPKCCGECGAPWERVVERPEPSLSANKGPKGREYGTSDVDRRASFHVAGWRQAEPDISRTLGWCSTCDHNNDSGRSVVLDPFCGSGTTGVVALRHDRSFIGIELSSDYCELARNRIRDDAPLLNTQLEVAA